MSALSRSPWGLSSDRTERWWDRPLPCRNEPDWWCVTAGGLSEENQAAARICHVCPVRRECLADATGADLRGVIAGGQWLDEKGAVRPVLGSEPQPRPNKPPLYKRSRPEAAATAIRVARHLPAGVSVPVVAVEYGLSTEMLRRARVLVRRAPKAAAEVESGVQTITGAYRQLTRGAR